MTSAIYKITNTANAKVYVGSAVDFELRWQKHRRCLRSKTHGNLKLQRAWSKHGEAAFEFEVIECVGDATQLIGREQHWIDLLDACATGYNIATVAGSMLGFKFSDESKAKMAAAQTGRTHSDETRAKIRAAWTPEARASKAAAMKLAMTPEHLAKMAAAGKAAMTPEKMARIVLAGTTPEVRAKRAAAMTGRKHSDETKAKMAANAKSRWATGMYDNQRKI